MTSRSSLPPQNFEDIVLWRVLKDVEGGCYVDVGACDPVLDSISWSFYERGWRGALIEPVPSVAALLRKRRPEDITIEAAAGTKSGTGTLFVSEPVGNSTLSRDVAERLAAAGNAFSEITVRIATLDELLGDAGFDGRTIHFCTIDVEGSEADVLAGFDLVRWRPWILVVEATEPNQPRASARLWERYVIEAGYRFCLFDGLNRFYVHPHKADDFAEELSYPACVFDAPFYRAVSAARRGIELERIAFGASRRADEFERAASEASRRSGDLERIASEASRRSKELERIASEAISRADQLEEISSRVFLIERENAALAARASEAMAELSAVRATVSWRVTRPLRVVRGRQLNRVRRRASASAQPSDDPMTTPVDGDLGFALARRLTQATEVLRPDVGFTTHAGFDETLAAFEEALTSSTASDGAKAWLSLVAADGRFPGERSVERFARVLRMNGAAGLRRELLRRFRQSVEEGLATTGELDVRSNRIVVDVTHTAMASDLHSGIQRVVRETVTCWLDSGRPIDLIRFDLRLPAARLLSSQERDRFKKWRDYVGPMDTMPNRARDRVAASTVVPWQCHLVVPELPFEAERTAAYRGLGTASVLRSLSMVGYDVIPIVAAEKVVTQVMTDFGGYLSVVKHADRVSTISETSRVSFDAFATMAAAEGLRRPRVEAHELPAEAPELNRRKVEAARSSLGIGAGPVIVVVGSHEPRKNHLAVLEAAERLWVRGDRSFELLFLGWSGWLGEDFDDLVARLVAAGRPIVVRKRCSEDELWAAYRFARFTVFPSLLEGYGLPIAESLASGTPVITSNYGSMAEVAEKGGCLLVDPRNVDELEHAMAELLDDDDALNRLRAEARGVDTGTWEGYASQLWNFFFQEAVDEPPVGTP